MKFGVSAFYGPSFVPSLHPLLFSLLALPPSFSVDSIRGFEHAAGFVAARWCLRFVVDILVDIGTYLKKTARSVSECFWFSVLLCTIACISDSCIAVRPHRLYHGLRGSASPMLTATGLVNGRWQFFGSLQNRHPLTDRQKICQMWLSRRPLQLCQIWCTSALEGLWANGWNIT